MSDEMSEEESAGQVLYLDNAATSFPKAPGVVEAVVRFLEDVAGSAGRGSHTFAAAASGVLWRARRELSALMGTREPTRWVFTLNATDGLNMALKGFLGPGSHVITSALEHNAVARCLRYLERERGVEITRLPYVPGCVLDPTDIPRFVRHNTRLVVVVHASNVTGEIAPIAEVARKAHECELPVLVDVAQTAGVLELRVDEWRLDMVAVTGHKGLLGPQGTGALFVREGLQVEPLRHGGTGSQSEKDTQPEFWPDAMESGTMNGPGIAGLQAGIQWVREQTVERIRRHEIELMKQLLEGLADIAGVEIYGPRRADMRVGLVCFNVGQEDAAWVAAELEARGVLTRAGLHCAPWAHECLGTLERGAVRMSVGPFVSAEQIDKALAAVWEIAKKTLT